MEENTETGMVIDAKEVRRLAKLRGLSVAALAGLADVHEKTLRGWLKGKIARINNIAALAKALNRQVGDILVKPINQVSESLLGKPEERKTTATLNITITTDVDCSSQIGALAGLASKVINDLENTGVKVTSHTNQLSIEESVGGGLDRVIVLINGLLKDGSSFWVFAAVKPHRYGAYLAAQSSSELDLYNFDVYGEIIYSGNGRMPPAEVIDKVADMYRTDAKTLMSVVANDQ